MRPSLSVNDCLKSIPADGIFVKHAVAGLSLGVFLSDFQNVMLSEHGLRAIGTAPVLPMLPESPAKDSGGMEEILAGSNDFEVFEPVVVLDSVDVINHQRLRNGANENLVNEAMNLEGFDLRGSGSQGEDIVSVLVDAALDDLPPSANNPALVGDLIAFPSGEVRPCFDLFHDRDVR